MSQAPRYATIEAMAGELFEVDDREIEELRRFFGLSKRQFAKAAGQLLNDFAFGTRNTAIEVIRERMVVRNPRFIERRLQVEKTHTRMPMESQRAEVGSTFFKRFSGWEEQQLGKKTTREKVINLLARGKSRTKQVRGPARLKAGKDFESYHKYPGQGVEKRNVIMLQRLDRRRWKKPFLVLGKRGMRSGLYRFIRRKPRLLQVFDPRETQPKRIPWLTDAEARYFLREDIGRLWYRKISRILRLG